MPLDFVSVKKESYKYWQIDIKIKHKKKYKSKSILKNLNIVGIIVTKIIVKNVL